MYISFCIQLSTLIWLGEFFVILLCCYFYVMSQSTLSDQIRPRPLIACLNCATHWVQGMFSHLCEVLYVYKYTYIYSHRILSLVILAYYHNNCLSYKIQIPFDWLISKSQRTWLLLGSYYDVLMTLLCLNQVIHWEDTGLSHISLPVGAPLANLMRVVISSCNPSNIQLRNSSASSCFPSWNMRKAWNQLQQTS